MSTIVGNVKDLVGNIAQVPVRFRTLGQATVAQGAVIFSGADAATRSDATGAFTITLIMGNYQMIVGDKDIFELGVPDDSSTYNVLALLTGLIIFNPLSPTVVNMPAVTNARIRNGEWQIINKDTGLFHDFWLEGPDGAPTLAWSLIGVA